MDAERYIEVLVTSMTECNEGKVKVKVKKQTDYCYDCKCTRRQPTNSVHLQNKNQNCHHFYKVPPIDHLRSLKNPIQEVSQFKAIYTRG